MTTTNIILAFLAACLVAIVGVYAIDEITQTKRWPMFVEACENTIIKIGARLGIRSYQYAGRH